MVGHRFRRTNRFSLRGGICLYYAVWWEGKIVQKKALTKLFGRNLSSFIIRYIDIGFARNYYRQRAIYWVERAAMCKRKKTAWTTTREDGGESSSFCLGGAGLTELGFFKKNSHFL
jgi:hypothetical protein